MTAATEGDDETAPPPMAATSSSLSSSLAPPSPSPPSQSSSSFPVDWDPGLDAYLSQCFGTPKWERTKRALASSPASTSLRLASAEDAAAVIARAERQGWEAFVLSKPAQLSRLNVVLVRERVQEERPQRENGPPPPAAAVVVVSRVAGEAALRGAPVFAPGVLACTRGVSAGDAVEVRVAIEPRFDDSAGDGDGGEGGGEGGGDEAEEKGRSAAAKKKREKKKKKLSNAPSSVRLRAGHGVRRGTVFSSAAEASLAAPLCLGVGAARMGRKEMTGSDGGERKAEEGRRRRARGAAS